MIDLHALRQEHGGTIFDGGRRWVGPGPGHSRQDRSLSVVVITDGRPLLHSFAGDPFPACANHIGLERSAKPASRADLARMRTQREIDRRRLDLEGEAFCASVWSGSQPIEATPAESYLFGRGLIYEGSEVRFHPAAPRSRRPDGPAPHPAMIALVRGQDGRGRGLHCTYITRDGRKAFGGRSRLMHGRCSGGAVRLAPIGPDGVLAVAEGIETAGAFSTLHGVPAWAALSTSGLISFKVPPGIRRLVIAADSDDSGAGLVAARELAERAKRRGEVQILPAPQGKDWSDVLTGRAHG